MDTLIVTAPAYTDESGLVAVSTTRRGRRVLTGHVWRGDGSVSVCGRWTVDQLDPDLIIDRDVIPCGVCAEHAPRYT